MRKIVLLCLLALVGAAAADESYPLKFKWRAGQEFRHAVKVGGQVWFDGKPLNEFSYSGTWVRRIVSVDAEGTAGFEAESRDVNRSDAFQLYDFGGVSPGLIARGRIKSNGKIVLMDHAQPGDPEYWSLLIFPDQPVPLNGAWKYAPPAEALAREMGVEAKGEITYQLKEKVRYKGRECLKVFRESQFKIGYDPRNELRDLAVDTRGVIWFDTVVGNLVDAELEEVYTGRVLREGEPPHEVKAKATIEFRLTR